MGLESGVSGCCHSGGVELMSGQVTADMKTLVLNVPVVNGRWCFKVFLILRLCLFCINN